MNMDAPTFMALMGGVTVLIGLSAAFSGWVGRIGKGEAANEIVKAQELHIERVERDLAEFKTHVAANYASTATLDQMEKRVVDAINRLGDRLDKLFQPAPPRP